MPPVAEGLHLDFACGYATFLAQLGWRHPAARLVGLNVDFSGPHAQAQSLLQEAGVTAALVQADARRMPFADSSLGSASCFLGLQDIEIGFSKGGVRAAVVEAVRVLGPGGTVALLDEFSFEKLDALLDGLPLAVTDRAERTLDVRWEREVAEQAIVLYAEGWAAQVRVQDEAVREQVRRETQSRMSAEMEHQLAAQGYYVPFGPVRMLVAKKQEPQ
jgi:ubiquinone/menaquinone biosynthesis C-methylase UbiE